MDDEIKAREEAMFRDIEAQIAAFGKERYHLIPILQMIQKRHAYLHPASIKMVAGHLEIYVWRIAGLGNIGPPPGNGNPLPC